MEITCPKCGARYKISETTVGKLVKCKATSCGQIFTAIGTCQDSGVVNAMPAEPSVTLSADTCKYASRASNGPGMNTTGVSPSGDFNKAKKLLTISFVFVGLILVVEIFVGMILVVAIAGNIGKGSTGDSSRSAPAADDSVGKSDQGDVQQDVVVSSDIISCAYRDNAVGADEQFRDKTLKVVGNLVSATTTLTGNVTITLGGIDSNTVCYMRKDQRKEVANLKRRGVVIIIGVCRGQNLGHVVIENCIVDKEELETVRHQWAAQERKRREAVER